MTECQFSEAANQVGRMNMAEGRTVRRHVQDRYRLLIESIIDYAIYMLDEEGHVASWNPGARRLKGYEPDEILGRHFSNFYTPEDRDAGEPWRGLEAAKREGRFENEGWRIRKDGSRFWASIVIDAIRDDDGHLIGFAKITRDISEKHQAQLALAQAREDLFQAQKLEAIGQMTGGIAHDFNNVLTAILGSLHLLKKRLPDDPELAQLLESALRGAERGASLTKRLLAFSRRQELHVREVEIAPLVEGLIDLASRSIDPDTRIETQLEAALPPVRTDPAQLEMALLNLIVNARDAMPEGGVIRIQAQIDGQERDDTGDQQFVSVAVIDDGEGMDAETLQKATTPFFTTKGIGKGTGLGLAMVQALTEQSGGFLRLHSEPGFGTRAEIILPVAVSTAVSVKSKEPLNCMSAPFDKKLTVLAVDDDALVLMNTTMMLEDLGHTVIEAFNGPEALKVLQSRQDIDMVITDQSMPMMTGVELADRVQEAHPSIPVILATGYSELPTGQFSARPHLNKPFTQHELQTAIAGVFSQS